MINRGLSKTSAYVFNADTGMLEKKDPQTIESLSKQLNQSINNLEDIPANKTEDIEPNNNIVVITADDNLIHNYFYDLDVSWDSSNCLSTAIIKMPKMDTENTNYWATYQGQLTIYIGHNFTFDYVNNNKFSNEQDAANSLSKYWDNSNIKPFFRGEVARIKEFQSEITIYVDSIGRRFQQKIPEEFRQSYIYNQNVRDAFQAICEFLGVQHICPPQTVTDNGETTEEAEEDGGKSDADTKVQQEQQISSQVRNIVQSDTDSENNDDEDSEENTDDANLTNNEEITKPMDGYGNVNFYCDHARPDYIDKLKRSGIRAINANKEVLEGISMIAKLFKTDKLFILEDNVTRFKDEIYNYVWQKGKDDPVKQFDDVLDSLRYAIYSESKRSGKMFDRNKYNV